MRRAIGFLRALFAKMFRGRDGRSTDPYAGVRQPVRGKPGGRSSAIALEEPDGIRDSVNAVGRKLHR